MRNMDKSLECSICIGDFSQPKQLPCFHSFCLKCLNQYCEKDLAGKRKPCPLCRKEFYIPEGGVKDFNSDKIIERLLIEKRLQEGHFDQLEAKCELCVEVGEEVEAKHFCMECKQSLCGGCKLRHLKQALFKLHKIVGIEDRPSEIELQRMKSSYCDNHSTKEIELYCCDCKNLICMMCYATSHSGHQCQVISETAKVRRQLSDNDREELERCRTESINKMKLVEKVHDEWKSRMSTNKNEINGAHSKCLELLSHHKDRLQLKTEELCKERNVELKTQREIDQLRYVELDAFITYSRMVMERGTDCEIIRVADELHKRAEELIKSQGEYNKRVLTDRTVTFLPSAHPTEQQMQDLMGGFLYTGEWNNKELEVSSCVEAQWRGSAEREKEEKLRREAGSISYRNIITVTILITVATLFSHAILSIWSDRVTLENADLTNKLTDLRLENNDLTDNLTYLRLENDDLTDRLTYLSSSNTELGKQVSDLQSDLTVCNKVRKLQGTLRILVVVGLNTGDSVEQKTCLVNLDRKNTSTVINSIPTWKSVESAACVINNFLYAVGIGFSHWHKELWKWSAERDELTRLADMPSGRRRHCATSVGEKIFVLGGWVDDGQRTLDSVLFYDINTDKWTQVTQLCHAVHSAACVTYKHFIYVFGGADKDDKSVNHVQVYDASTGEVTLSSNPMPAAQSKMRAVLWKSKALLIGRWTCYIYDFELNLWEERRRFKTDVIHFGLTLNDDTLYISGGGTGRIDENNKDKYIWTCSDEVKSLSVDDFISDNQQAEWTHHAKLPHPALVHSFNSQPLYRYI